MEKTYVFEGNEGNSSGVLSLLAPLLNRSGIDPNVLLAMRNNNGFGGDGGYFIWFLFLVLLGWGRNGFNGGDCNGCGCANAINSATGRELLMSGIQGNGNAISQLSTMLNCSTDSIKDTIFTLSNQIQNIGSQNGMGFQQVINAIQSGNCSIANQIVQCCCDTKEAITKGNYENQIANLQQTNQLTGRIDQLANGITQGFSATNYETFRQTCDLKGNADANTRAILAKLDAIEDSRKDREIAALTAKLTAADSRAERAAERQADLTPIYNALNEIKCKQPNTVTIPYSPVVGVPSCVAYQYGMGYPFAQGTGVFS